ncbi:MAG: hypothetical protein J6W76_08680 [Spirochaetales bacterium]|nr:hypothetical protein [Spirochaetales bacterium]
MKYFFYSISSLLILSLLFVLQNILLLTTVNLDYIYQSFAAMELYASLCILYFALRFLSERRLLPVRHLFVCVFSATVVYCAAVIIGADFNILNIAVSIVCSGLLLSGIVILMFAFMTECHTTAAADIPTDCHIFSDRECDVIRTIVQGQTVKETADILCISTATVKTHLLHI